MILSVVTTLYKSEPFIGRFINEINEAVRGLNIADYEIVVVNDGSPDNSLEATLKIKEQNPHVVVVDLSRNFGHHYALMAGMEVSKGDYVFTIDCDLEVNPNALKDFWEIHLNNLEIDRIYGVAEKRKGGFAEKFGGAFFYKMYNSMSETSIPTNILTESLMTRQYVDELVKMGDANLFLAGMYSWVGFKQMPTPCKKGVRETKSTYTLRKRIALSLQAISSFSAYPLRILFTVGSILSLMSFLFGLYLIINKLIRPDYVLAGFTSLSVLILFSVGIIVMSLGILGIYREKLYNQTKGRQRYIIRRIY